MADHPTPEPTHEQFADWLAKAVRLHPIPQPCDIADHVANVAYAVARLAYAAGADAELEACDEWLCEAGLHGYAYLLRAARRPKPQSLKEQALSVLPSPGGIAMKHTFHPDHIELLRRAIEALPEEVL